MAGFKTHITFSSMLGVGYGTAAWWLYDVPVPTCLLAGGLCGVSGMLPDIDSDSGVPVRESLAFAAAVIPMMLVARMQHLGWPHESIVLAGAAAYLFIRFAVGGLLKKYTVHRGMFHSLPAAAIFGELAFLLSAGEDVRIRYYKAGAVVLGYLSHLLLDELFAFQFKHGRPRLKSSFGTAVKLIGDNWWSNLSTYGKLALVSLLVMQDPGSLPADPAEQGAAARGQMAGPQEPDPNRPGPLTGLRDALHLRY